MRFLFICLLLTSISFCQVQNEVAPPPNIKTVSMIQSGQNVVAHFRLGSAFELQFDDLFGDEADYYYTITHCNYDWTPSNIAKNEYLTGNDDMRIQQYQNSLNTLQIFSHYTLRIPNQFTQIKLSGNYIIKIFDDEKKLIFSRRIMVYEDLCVVPVQVRRSRDINTLPSKHNLDFSINSLAITFQNPNQNIKILIQQNGQFHNAIYNVKPQYNILNELVYKYNKETQFWAGNESLYWDNKDIRVATNTINKIELQKLYHTQLHINQPRSSRPYTYYPDINNNFFVHNMYAESDQIEADYSWVFLKLQANELFDKKNVYVTGMFNNYEQSENNRLKYNAQSGLYECTLLAKQGFTSYQFLLADKNGKIDEANAIDGNFFQTENTYTVMVYYRENGSRYDRIIGLGSGNSQNIIN